MNTQPEALRLAYWMDDMPSVIPGNDSNEWHKAAAELRRLDAENAKLTEQRDALLEALEAVMDEYEDGYGLQCVYQVKEAIAKVKKETA